MISLCKIGCFMDGHKCELCSRRNQYTLSPASTSDLKKKLKTIIDCVQETIRGLKTLTKSLLKVVKT